MGKLFVLGVICGCLFAAPAFAFSYFGGDFDHGERDGWFDGWSDRDHWENYDYPRLGDSHYPDHETNEDRPWVKRTYYGDHPNHTPGNGGTSPVPEPTGAALFGIGLFAAARAIRRGSRIAVARQRGGAVAS
jgi:hypothetical protein